MRRGLGRALFPNSGLGLRFSCLGAKPSGAAGAGGSPKPWTASHDAENSLQVHKPRKTLHPTFKTKKYCTQP